VVVFFIGAYINNKITPSVYQNSTVLLFSGSNSEFVFDGEKSMQGINRRFSAHELENEMGILQSYPLVKQALQQLDFDISYYFETNLIPKYTHHKSPFIITRELYRDCPFTVIFDREKVQPLGLPFSIEFLPENKFRIRASGTNLILYSFLTEEEISYGNAVNLDAIYEFGENISSQNFHFKIMLNENFANDQYKSGRLYFQFNHTNYQTLEYLSSLNVWPNSMNSTLVSVALTGKNKIKITDFLNTFTEVYLERNLERKNRMAVNTVNFIERQIKDISDSLQYTEGQLQDFRTSHKVMDLSFQGQKIYDQLMTLENSKAQLLMQEQYYNYIKEYLTNNQDASDLAAPSSMGVEDRVLSELISKFILKTAERDNLKNKSNKQSIFLGGIEREIKNLRKTILENVSYNLSTTQMSINDINNRSASMSAQIARLPQTERQLFGIKRKFNLTDAIYTFLLEKLAEAQISQAAHTPDCEVIDPARYITASPIAPKRNQAYIIAIFLGLIVPFIYILIKDALNDKVTNRKDIDRHGNLPLIGQVLHNDHKDKLVLANYPDSIISGSIRAVCTYIQLLYEPGNNQIVLITSSLNNEGRKLISANIATAYAQLGKRTVLMSFNINDPSLYEILHMDNSVGLGNYIANKATLDDIIQTTSIENLDFISSGQMIKSSLKLISSGKTISLITKLKEIYDQIIIDTSPIGLITDTFLLMKQADVNILVARENHTKKSVFSSVVHNVKANKIDNVSVLLNDVKPSRNPYEYGHELTYLKQINSKRKLTDFFFQRD
jgi:capsular exopolysaccharide synthesis family protein